MKTFTQHKSSLWWLGGLITVVALLMASCTDNDDVFNRIPSQISRVMDQYYPNSAVSSFAATDSTYTLVIKDGPTMVFDNHYEWISLNGNGSILPQNFLFNELPPELYEYLQETDNLDNIFSVSHNSKTYTVDLLNNILEYNISTGRITGHDPTE